jgi:TB2/DP1, HVA22 family
MVYGNAPPTNTYICMHEDGKILERFHTTRIHFTLQGSIHWQLCFCSIPFLVMRRIDSDKLLIYSASTLLLVLSVPLLSKLPRSRGKKPLFHIAFLVVAIASLIILPSAVQDEIFSAGGVVVIGTILPIYESVRAICTVCDADDTVWLQFWIASGVLSYTTEFVDEIREYFPKGGEHWYEFEFFFIVWLMFPLTDGSTLVFEALTEPYISPFAKRIKGSVEGWIAVILTFVNTSYLAMVWWIFMFLPEEARRFAVIAIGTIYPLAASTVAITTSGNTSKNTFWLTYWCCFSLLFLAMDYLENMVGGIPGFYSLCLSATVYLFLPMFDGANVVFRRLLVPVTGQYENMLLRDTYLVRTAMEKSIPTANHDRVFQKAAKVFATPKQE